jgi:short subunit dehydrogenase-like uncharacterized protein
MKEGLLIYGCNGYTGKLISEHAVSLGMKPILAGRDREKVSQLANALKLDYKVFDLDDEKTVADNIKDFKIVLHCAGPFKYTARIMALACISAGTHYLDITGEYYVFEEIYKMDEAAKKAGVVLMPGVGFDVVPTDCLSLYLKEQLPDATSLELALYMKNGMLSHGTAITVAENLGESCILRRDGKLVKTPNGQLTRDIDIDGKRRTGVAISWGDVSSAFRTTGIKNITVFNVLPAKLIQSMKMSNYLGFFFRMGFVKNYLIKKIKQRPAGPDETKRKNAQSIVWGEAKNSNGNTKSVLLELPEGYTLTAWTAVKIAQQMLQQSPPSGARTPASVFGSSFILGFEGVKRSQL